MILKKPSIKTFLWRSVASQMITYMVFGMIFSFAFNYSSFFGTAGLEGYMRPTTHPIVALGPALQLFRGLLFGLILYPLWKTISSLRGGWLLLWGLFLALAIFGVCGPAPGSLEGVVYTQLPLFSHLLSLPEIVLQTLGYSLMLFYWNRYPRKGIQLFAIIAIVLIFLMGILGYAALSGWMLMPEGMH